MSVLSVSVLGGKSPNGRCHNHINLRKMQDRHADRQSDTGPLLYSFLLVDTASIKIGNDVASERCWAGCRVIQLSENEIASVIQ